MIVVGSRVEDIAQIRIVLKNEVIKAGINGWKITLIRDDDPEAVFSFSESILRARRRRV
jgi:hypothetical protein